MKILKIIIQALLVPLILVSGYQAVVVTIGFIGTLSGAATPYTIGYWVGSLTMTVLTLIFSVWAFRRLRA